MKGFSTLKDVARLAGTSAATVSYVLNDKKGRYIGKEMRQKVLDAAKELDYIKCTGASSLKGKERKLIGILIPQFENQFFSRIITASESVFVQNGYDLLICNTLDRPERERDILKRMLEQRVDGIILTPTIEGRENTTSIRRVGMNMVVVDRPLAGLSDYNWVTTNNYGCGETGAKFLFEKGHRKIAYVGWHSGIEDLNSREKAIFDQAEEFGIKREDIIVYNGEFSPEDGYRMTEEIIEKNKDITAIFYGFNRQAIGGVNCLRDKGVRIPEDLSVIIIGSPEWATAGKNNFTHVDMGDMELGAKAASLLLKQIKSQGRVSNEHIIQDCTLVEGDSVMNIKNAEGDCI